MSEPRRVIVEVRWGPLASRKAIVRPGETLTVGRTTRSALVIPHDLGMSAVHFAIQWDGERCWLEDLKSAKGTELDGEPITRAEVAHGSWIQAGETVFLVYYEDTRPLREDMTPAKEHALAALRAEEAPLFAVFDPTRGDAVLELLRESVEDYRSLYDGTQGAAMQEVAPHVVTLAPGSSLLERMVREGWGRRWGIYFTCPRSIEKVRTHLRRFLMVRDDESGKKLYFRYYNPGVLRVFLPACTSGQQAQFFGELGCFILEGEEGEVLRFDPPTGAALEAR